MRIVENFGIMELLVIRCLKNFALTNDLLTSLGAKRQLSPRKDFLVNLQDKRVGINAFYVPADLTRVMPYAQVETLKENSVSSFLTIP